MTADQLYQWKVNVRLVIVEQLCMQLLRKEAHSQEDPEQWLKDWAKKTEYEFAKLNFPTNEPVQSDMLAAEAQDCVKAFVSSLLSKS